MVSCSTNYLNERKEFMFKKTISLLFAAIMIIALVGCGAQKREPIILTLSTEDAEAILNAAGIYLPDADEIGCAGTIVQLYGYRNDLQNYSENEMVETGYWTFRERYGCDIEWVECTFGDRWTRLASLLLAGDAPDFYPAWATDFPIYCLDGMFAPIDDYINYDDPLWEGMKYMADTYFSIGGHHYVFITDVVANCSVFYNRRVFDEHGYEDPAELFYNNEWTWDKMMDMSLDFNDPDEGRYAFNAWHTEEALFTSTGTFLVEYNPETGEYQANLDDPRIERAANWLYELMKNELHYPMWTTGWSLNYGAEGGGMKEGMTLFAMDPWYVFDECRSAEEYEAVYGDIRGGELMIVPVPRDPNGDGEYYIDSKIKGYNLILGASHPEAVALLASCDRFKVVDPTVVNIDRRQLKEKKGWTDEMLDMWDTMYEISHSHNTLIMFENGLGDAAKPVDDLFNYTRNGGDTSWAQRKEKYGEQLQHYLDELNAKIKEIE